MIKHRFAALLPLALLTAGCGGGVDQANNVDSLDEELAAGTSNNAADPLLRGALQDQIMVDPQLAQRANAAAVRPPSQPYSAPLPSTDVARGRDVPLGVVRPAPAAKAGGCPDCLKADEALTLGALASGGPGAKSCAGQMRYAAGWANRLPDGLPLHPRARVIEAAGTDADGCTLRAVSFTVPGEPGPVVDWYATRATDARYGVEHQADGGRHVLGGTRRDGAAYVAYINDNGDGGTSVTLVADRGR